jgi:hypothetical protein
MFRTDKLPHLCHYTSTIGADPNYVSIKIEVKLKQTLFQLIDTFLRWHGSRNSYKSNAPEMLSELMDIDYHVSTVSDTGPLIKTEAESCAFLASALQLGFNNRSDCITLLAVV